jgi:hypothetical protein
MSVDDSNLFSTLLMVLGTDLDPDRVTAALGVEPDQTWRRGSTETLLRTDDGAPRVMTRAKPHEWGGWKKVASDELRQFEVARQLRHWLELLEPRHEAVQSLLNADHQVFIDIYVATASACGFTLPAAVQARMAALGVDLQVNVYADDPA